MPGKKSGRTVFRAVQEYSIGGHKNKGRGGTRVNLLAEQEKREE